MPEQPEQPEQPEPPEQPEQPEQPETRGGLPGGDGEPSAADSAGVGWAGRRVTSTGFDGDTGEADPQVLAAVRAYADAGPGAAADRSFFETVAAARWLVPMVAAASGLDEHGGHAGLAVETTVDMAVALLVAPTGERALPVFTGLASLAAWDASARPVPVTAARAAQAAVQDRCGVLVVDPAGPVTVVVRASLLWALAQQREWLPAAQDPVVARAVQRAVDGEPAVASARVGAGEPATTTRVTLALRPGLDQGEVAALATRVGERLATDGEVRARIDELSFAITSDADEG